MSHPGRRIARARKRRGLKQHELADAADVSVSTLGRIERGQTLDSAAVPKLEEYLGLEPEQPAADTGPDDAGEARYTLRQARRKLPAWELLAELADRLSVTEPGVGMPLPQHPHEWDSDEGLSHRIRAEEAEEDTGPGKDS